VRSGKDEIYKSYLARRLALSLIIGGMFVSSAYALPQGGAVVGGGSNGNIGGSGNVMDIIGTGIKRSDKMGTVQYRQW